MPDGFVFLAGIAAYWCTLRTLRTDRPAWLVVAGLLVLVGVHFKTVAGFYGMAQVAFLILEGWRQRAWRKLFVAWLPCLAAGATIGLLAPVAYFKATGRLEAFWQWTFYYPSVVYPSQTTNFFNLYTKLGAVHLVFLVALFCSLMPGWRRQIYADQNRGTVLALTFGLFSYLVLFKGQASHYCFPGAPFFFIFSAAVFLISASRFLKAASPRRIAAALFAMAAVLFLMALTSVLLYRPAALKRFAMLRDYSDEQTYARFIQSYVPPGKHFLMFVPYDETYSYWVSHRYPPKPFVSIDEKCIWFFRNHPETVLAVLDDPGLMLVGFRPDKVELVDQTQSFGTRAEDIALWRRFEEKLRHAFEPIPDIRGGVFWKRRAGN